MSTKARRRVKRYPEAAATKLRLRLLALTSGEYEYPLYPFVGACEASGGPSPASLALAAESGVQLTERLEDCSDSLQSSSLAAASLPVP